MEGGGDGGHGDRRGGHRRGLEVAGVRHGEWVEEDDDGLIRSFHKLGRSSPPYPPDFLTAAFHAV